MIRGKDCHDQVYHYDRVIMVTALIVMVKGVYGLSS